MLAVKGASAADEVERDAPAVRRLGGGSPRIEQCGVGIVEPPCTVVRVSRVRRASRPAGDQTRRGRA